MHGSIAVVACLLFALIGTAHGQALWCAQDLNGDGGIDGPGEQAMCSTTSAGSLCPIARVACNVDATTGTSACPTNPARPCIADGNASYCSINDCFERNANPPVTDPPAPTPSDDGPRDEAGNCLGEIQVFPGKALRCRLGGTQTAYRNCCRNRGAALSDSLGSSVAVTATTTVLGAVASAAQAAVTGGVAAANQALVAAFDPTTLAIAVAVALITELLADQCDERDMEAALLNSSGYCVELGRYCAEDWAVGCVQRATAYCCFNSKLARIIHEQGRQQLPLMGAFGTPEEPNCRGFRADEFQALDFSKIDLTEYYEEIRTQSQAIIEENARENALQSLGQ